METYSSGEDLLIKARKPYTITKQREKWTEEEHNRFLDALKLYGRAWQRIEEYIGTKTAVQIRSHAQKFFTKLEKEAHIKGVPIGQTLEIEIPPPRPKRKPSNPYPRKTGVGTPASQVGVKDGKLLPSVSSSCTGKQILDLEKKPLLEKPGGDGKLESANGTQDEENCSEVITFSQTAPCSSSFAGKNSLSTPAPRSLCTFRDFVPMITPVTHDETSESHITAEPKGNRKFVELDTKPPIEDNGSMGNTSNLGNPTHSQGKMVQGWTTAEQMQPENVSSLSSNDMQATQNYPRHVPVHVLNRSVGMNKQNISPYKSYHESMFKQIGVNGYPNLFANPATSATIECYNASKSSVDQPSPTFHPLCAPVRKNHDGNGSLFQISSTFSSLFVSTLLQNPAAHAAASFAATFWPFANTGASADSLAGPPTLGGLPSPSMAAVAATTVAAATAWWASHGLLPFCAPFQTGFTCNPACTTDTCQNAAADNECRENLPRDPEKSEALQEQPSASKSLTLSSSDSEESEGAKRHTELASTDHDKVAGVTELHESNKAKSRKLVDRSSCGSNTASSSEVETDALEKYENGKEESKEPDAGHSAGDSNNRRGRSSCNINDSWKEVSEGGRLAFQALFSRQVLPQSFSPPQDLKSKGHQKINFEKNKQNMDEKIEDGSCLDLNSETGGACSSHQRVESNEFLGGKNNGEGGLLTIGIEQGKLRACRTGFKPYKRCSVEAEEIMVASACSQGEEKGPKRIRLEGETST